MHLIVEKSDVVVIGAGQAGLSSAYFLERFGLEPVVLDAEPGPGGAWRHRSPSLTMDKVHGVFDLPGVRRPGDEDGGVPVAEVVPAYFGDYERTVGLDVVRPVKVGAVRRGAGASSGGLLIETDAGEWAARAVVNATGTWTRPYWPYYPGASSFAGRQLHYADYRGPGEFAGRRVVVVGGGHSAMHVLSEIAGVAAATTWVTRRPAVLREEEFSEDARRAAVAMVEERVRAGLPPESVVSVTGLRYTPVVREALDKGALTRFPMFQRITADGVTWADGRHRRADTIIWATGFRSALDHLAPLRLREPGGGIKMDGTQVVAEPALQLVGYGPSASTIGANRAGREAARNVRAYLTAHPARPAA
ncbi:cation diffusion facilitator CzcD-associated flavoprotein CzcO [Nonomuraea polychroma]|uniref:Cation diffusion facilitator CzcD-associated flavoprotein CzcO n=1 Tax=Nonomuraea polychroma TaxID=46176 RepID=A0A438M3X1_9ACTN|nr:FAD-dependent oxidoreductase [Nonomuraea polychroma]RVX40509.1 cation diffusion facilitator CzcD-associated flavoprotein CzcO [Nonomuraea polychroma]